ncbi:MAG: ion channel [Pseudomonadota bacterium]
MGQITIAEWIVVGGTALVVLLAVVFHYEVIAGLNRWVAMRNRDAILGHPHRTTLLAVMFLLIVAHVVEIWLFAVTYWLMIELGSLGQIQGYEAYVFFDYVYFSATTYTTVGWGDLSSIGPVRFLAGTQALVGFMLITWSASFTYLIMARTWSVEGHGQP